MNHEEIYDKVRLIRRELFNNDPLRIEEFGSNDVIMQTPFASTVEIQQYLQEFNTVFFSGNGLVLD